MKFLSIRPHIAEFKQASTRKAKAINGIKLVAVAATNTAIAAGNVAIILAKNLPDHVDREIAQQKSRRRT